MNDVHPKLEEQIKNFIGENSRLHKKIAGFLSAVNDTYLHLEEKLDDQKSIMKKYESTLLDKGVLMHENQVLNNEIQLKQFQIKQDKVQISNFEKLSKAGSFTLNLKSDLTVNSNQMSKMFDINEYESTYKNFTSLFIEANLINDAILNCKLTKSSIQFDEVRLIKEQKYYSISGEVIQEKGDELLQVVVKDLTPTKKHEHELENAILNLEFYKSVIDQTVLLSTINVDGNITFVNQNFTEISGYNNLEMIGKPFDFLITYKTKESSFEEIVENLKLNDNWKSVIKNTNKNGDVYWLDTTIIPFIKDEKIVNFISVQVDVTEKVLKEQKVEEQRAFYEMILNNLPLDIAVFNEKHEYIYVNPIGIKDPETRKFVIGKTDYDYCKHFNKDVAIADVRQAIFDQVLKSKKQLEFTDKVTNKEGKDVYVLRKFFPFLNAQNELEYMLGIGLDVTEKTEQSIQIKESLIEKDALLGEVHHRVKNNLSIFLGLVEMQMKRMKDKTIINEFAEIKNRIISMSLIHEKLYKSANFAQINLREYTEDFVSYLSKFFDAEQRVKINFELNEVFANTKNTVPLALIINELVTNSYKHAFQGIENPEITIQLAEKNSIIELSIFDNGIGLKQDFELMKLDSLGIRLIKIFTKQLRADFKVVNENGLCYHINFQNFENFENKMN
jgi:PAS domain S-box-containing protein